MENHEGVRRFEWILEASDGIMVAHGDQGIVIPAKKVFLAQKMMMIGRCIRAGKPAICATQMLESMIKKPCPTRACDVAVMWPMQSLMEQTASCCLEKQPRGTTLWRLFASASGCPRGRGCHPPLAVIQGTPPPGAHYQRPHRSCCLGTVEASFKCCSGAIILLTKSGRSAHQVARYCPRAPIIDVMCNSQTARQAHLYGGIFPVLCKDAVLNAWAEDVDLRVNLSMDVGKAQGFFKKGDVVIVRTGWRPGSGFTNTMHVVPVP